MAASYKVIRNWIRYWEKDLLDKPKEFVLGSEYFVNILPQAIESLERWQAKNAGLKLQKNSKTWERKLAELLERTSVRLHIGPASSRFPQGCIQCSLGQNRT